MINFAALTRSWFKTEQEYRTWLETGELPPEPSKKTARIHLTQADFDRIAELRNQKTPWRVIAEEFEISLCHISKLYRDHQKSITSDACKEQ